MPLQTEDFTTFVRDQVTAAQAESSALLDFTTGSILLALIEANTSGVALFLQALILQLLSITRLSTSQNEDADTWVGDFSLERLPSVPATGQVTFSRFTNTSQAVVLANAIPANSTQVQTADATQTFYVTIDTTNINYNSALGGYVIQAGTSSINVPVEAVVAGSGGNVAAAAISTLITPTPFVDTVTNASPFSNGIDEETDSAMKARFVAYIASLSRATKTAVSYAVSSVQQGLTFSHTENQNYAGQTSYGYFFVVVDDGSGTPSDALLASVSAAIELYRGDTIVYGVFAPVVTTANVNLTITVGSGYVHDTVAELVESAIQKYINSLSVGATLYYTQLIAVAYETSPGITNVSDLTINSGTSDLVADVKHVIKSGTVSVN